MAWHGLKATSSRKRPSSGCSSKDLLLMSLLVSLFVCHQDTEANLSHSQLPFTAIVRRPQISSMRSTFAILFFSFISSSVNASFSITPSNRAPSSDTKDAFVYQPEIISVDKHTVQLRVYPLKKQFESLPTKTSSDYYIVVVMKYKIDNNPTQPVTASENFYTATYQKAKEEGLNQYAIVSLPRNQFYPGRVCDITVGDEATRNAFTNPKLEMGREYSFGIAVEIGGNYEFKSTFRSIITGQSIGDNTTEVIQIIVIIFLAVLLCVTLVILGLLVYINYSGNERLINWVVFWAKPKKRHSFPTEPKRTRDRSKLLTGLEYEDELSEAFVEKGIELKSHPIPISELAEYAQNMTESEGFRQEYLSVPRGQSAKWDTAKAPENRGKNRYGNLLAYEHSRVELRVEEEDHQEPEEERIQVTDYINANWVDGYRTPNRYIATQGPMVNTITDFWRMTWQTESRCVVMLTNVEELGKNKCDRYWPVTGTEKYGAYKVTLSKSEMFADFIIRTFLVEKGSMCREVKQYHFVSWPDHTVPSYPSSVISFLQRIRTHPLYSNKEQPIIIHCSAGVGRTGTLLLIDVMLEMAKSEKHVDVLLHLCLVRRQRINMIEKMQQYVFVHRILVEALCHDQTDIDCNQLPNYLIRLKYTDPVAKLPLIEQQFQFLNKLTPSLNKELCSTAFTNSTLNRSNDIVPPNYARVILNSPEVEGDYINAVYVNGYKRRDAYIVTEVPLPQARENFWQMVIGTGAKTIVLLNELGVDDVYWPVGVNTLLQLKSKGEIRLVREEGVGSLTIRDFVRTDGTLIKQFHFRYWSPTSKLPPKAQQLVDLMERVEKWQVESSSPQLIVQCLNGVRACGLYCASSFICDRIKEEHQVDVFLASRTIRTQRPQFIEGLEQYKFLYDEAKCYLENFETYANFK